MTKPTAPAASERKRAERTRANGDGTTYRFGDRWRAAVPYRDPASGKTKYKVKIASTKREADRVLADMLRDRDAGLDLGKITVEQFLGRWLKNQKMRVKASTLRAH